MGTYGAFAICAGDVDHLQEGRSPDRPRRLGRRRSLIASASVDGCFFQPEFDTEALKAYKARRAPLDS